MPALASGSRMHIPFPSPRWWTSSSFLPIVILKHHANIRRLLSGTEPHFGKPKDGQAAPA